MSKPDDRGMNAFKLRADWTNGIPKLYTGTARGDVCSKHKAFLKKFTIR